MCCWLFGGICIGCGGCGWWCVVVCCIWWKLGLGRSGVYDWIFCGKSINIWLGVVWINYWLCILKLCCCISVDCGVVVLMLFNCCWLLWDCWRSSCVMILVCCGLYWCDVWIVWVVVCFVVWFWIVFVDCVGFLVVVCDWFLICLCEYRYWLCVLGWLWFVVWCWLVWWWMCGRFLGCCCGIFWLCIVLLWSLGCLVCYRNLVWCVCLGCWWVFVFGMVDCWNGWWLCCCL